MLALVVALSLAQSPKLVAPSWSAVEVSSEKAEFFANQFAAALRDQGLQVMSAQDIAVVLGAERQRQLLGCADESNCMVELGAALGAEHLLSGAIAKLENSYVVSLRVLRSTDGRVVAQEQAKGASQEALLESFTVAAASLARKLNPAGPGLRFARKWALIPAIAGGVALAVGGGFYGAALIKLDELDKGLRGSGNTPAVLEPIVAAGESFERIAWVGFGVAIAAGVTALVMYLLGEPAPATAAREVSHPPFALGGVW